MGTKRVTRSGKEQCVSNKPYFNFIEETLVSASGVKTKVCALPPGALNEEFKEGSHHYHGVVLERFGCGVNPHAHVHSNSSAPNIQNRKKGFTRGCKVNYLRKRSKRLAHKLIKYGKKLAPVPYFNFIEETLVSASGVKTKVCMLSPGEMYSALDEEFKEGSHHYHGVVLERFCIGTRHSNPEIRGDAAVPFYILS
ncbi:unnamed protein product [Eruca vesicaria subsp. sativa]|uniref:Uncharacterized protein n=1 Tax=Eruca vesicaria subsp. sativa TaxID=29727 RepID=A0ABC8JQ13_ERUVS|nr:unnamed protein product [Eruca vesicaria subsp. sativa]